MGFSIRDANLILIFEQHGDKDVPFIIAGNCCDVPREERRVEYEEGLALAHEFGVPFFECSAKNDINIDELFRNAACQGFDFAGFGKTEIFIKEGKLQQLMEYIPKLPVSQRFKKRDKVCCYIIYSQKFL
jgi:hypothetical protein